MTSGQQSRKTWIPAGTQVRAIYHPVRHSSGGSPLNKRSRTNNGSVDGGLAFYLENVSPKNYHKSQHCEVESVASEPNKTTNPFRDPLTLHGFTEESIIHWVVWNDPAALQLALGCDCMGIF